MVYFPCVTVLNPFKSNLNIKCLNNLGKEEIVQKKQNLRGEKENNFCQAVWQHQFEGRVFHFGYPKLFGSCSFAAKL